MRIPVETLIDGVMRTLREDVLPEVGSPRARARLWAALDILNNLRDRVEPKAWLYEAEVQSARDALAACAAQLRAAGREGDAERIVESVAKATAGGAAAEQAAALRDVLVATLALVGDSDEAAPARAPLESHLASQALREVMMLKPSLLTEISKG